MSEVSQPIVFYDGVCGLCNRLVQFLLKRDHNNRLRFAALQSRFASDLLTRHGAAADDLDTMYVVMDHGQPGERLLSRSDAMLHLLPQLGGLWRMAAVGRIIPRPLRNALYNLVARNRYRLFGKHESCMLPDPQHRSKFLEV